MAIQNWNSTESMKCPQCSEIMLHPASVIVNRGGEITTITEDGTRMSSGQAEGRGVMVEILLEGECGHSAIVTYQFHKGATVVEIAPGPDVESDPATGFLNVRTIWRD